MDPIISYILRTVAETFFSHLSGKIADNLYSKIKKDTAQKAFKKALGEAINNYANRNLECLIFAQPLLNKKSPLIHPEVAAELAEIVRFVREPDFKLIGRHWRESLDHPTDYNCDFTEQTQILLEYLRRELRDTEVFRPVFDAKSLDAIADSAEESSETLTNIENKLESLVTLLDARFGQLIRSFSRANRSILDQIYDFKNYIEEKTNGFVGRKWTFDSIERFISENPRGYFFILGDPGIGKSSLLSQVIKDKGYIHHFNIRSEGINKTATFLKNVCAQLIANYRLPHNILPPETINDADILKKLLNEVSEKLEQDERCVIIVDALDEIDTFSISPGENPLFLPITLPDHVYFIITMREKYSQDKQSLFLPRVECEQSELVIRHDSSYNISDITDYINTFIERPGIKEYIVAQRIENQDFVNTMVHKSEGNFMYLRYVLPEIESGVYQKRDLSTLPLSLVNYYEDHWRRMRSIYQEEWFKYKLPVIAALTVALEPISIDLISKFSMVKRKARIRAVLSEWAPFLHEEIVYFGNDKQRRYRLYHSSFFDFISSKQEVKDEHLDLKDMHRQIVATMLGCTHEDENKVDKLF